MLRAFCILIYIFRLIVNLLTYLFDITRWNVLRNLLVNERRLLLRIGKNLFKKQSHRVLSLRSLIDSHGRRNNKNSQ